MEIIKALPNQHQELAHFARHAYRHAFGDEIGSTALNQHLTQEMSDYYFKKILSVDTVYLALIDSKIVGFAQLGAVDGAYAEHIESFDGPGGELRRLYVEPELQSQGIGSQLMIKTINHLKQMSYRTVYLTTWESNVRAQEFYSRQGFSRVGQYPEYDNDGSLNGYEFIMLREL